MSTITILIFPLPFTHFLLSTQSLTPKTLQHTCSQNEKGNLGLQGSLFLAKITEVSWRSGFIGLVEPLSTPEGETDQPCPKEEKGRGLGNSRRRLLVV